MPPSASWSPCAKSSHPCSPDGWPLHRAPSVEPSNVARLRTSDPASLPPAHWSRREGVDARLPLLVDRIGHAATDDSMARKLSGRRASAFAVRGRLRGPTQRAAHRSARQHEDNSSTLHKSWRKVFHQRRKCCDHGKGRCDVVGAATRQELTLRTRRAQARCTQPRATLSSRKQSRRPHEYLTPLLTAEAGQQ